MKTTHFDGEFGVSPGPARFPVFVSVSEGWVGDGSIFRWGAEIETKTETGEMAKNRSKTP